MKKTTMKDMKSYNPITEGNLLRAMLSFSVPYLVGCFLQTFYGMADLFIIGQFNGAGPVTAVSVGSQMMHFLTVVIVGLVMGTTIMIGKSIGAEDHSKATAYLGNSVTVFAIVSLILTPVMLLLSRGILLALSTPSEAMADAQTYLRICFFGIPFIVAYNVISGIFRGLGNTTRPMIFVAIAGVINIGLDYLLIGGFGMGAAGAALATMLSQVISVLLALWSLWKFRIGIRLQRSDLKLQPQIAKNLFSVGAPIALQDGLIQVSFLVITAIANSRGVEMAAAVGIVEKIISFLFLVPSAMLSTVSAIGAQNIGAGKQERSIKALTYGIRISLLYGLVIVVICQLIPHQIVGMFVTGEEQVVVYGAQYLRSYAFDVIFAGVHFCFSGYFSACGKSVYSFIHNMTSVITVRVPGAYVASKLFAATLYPMGLAAPAGSALSDVICIFLFMRLRKRRERQG